MTALPHPRPCPPVRWWDGARGQLRRLGGALGALTLAPLWAAPPNVILILCDDLGYGDVACLNPDFGRIPTPAFDQLAREGMVFTNAHSNSSVCTPTRYGLMTGRYSWRSRLQAGVVTGYNPALIPTRRPTVATFFQSQGYHTALIGKWHLDFKYLDPVTHQPLAPNDSPLPPLGAFIPDGPRDRGFAYFHGFHHARQMEAIIQDRQVVAYDPAGHMLPRLQQAAEAYIIDRAAAASPFFLYLSLSSPHAPILPSPAWRGRSGLGDYGDFVMQTDAVIGSVLATLAAQGLLESTLVLVTSDNGASKTAGIAELAAQGHRVSAQWRGAKADLWEGGHRIPLLVRWPGVVAPGAVTDALVCLTDFYATVGEVLATPLPESAAEDSISFVPVLKQLAGHPRREAVILHSISGHFAYREGPWKLILARGSGGWSAPTETQQGANAPEAQLYNLDTDPGETINLYATQTALVAGLLDRLETAVALGRSTPGPPAANDVPVIELWKSGRARH